MPTQRGEEKRVEEHDSVRERERERASTGEGGGREGGRERERRAYVRDSVSMGEGGKERERGRKSFGSSFYVRPPRPGPALCKLGLARSAVCST